MFAIKASETHCRRLALASNFPVVILHSRMMKYFCHLFFLLIFACGCEKHRPHVAEIDQNDDFLLGGMLKTIPSLLTNDTQGAKACALEIQKRLTDISDKSVRYKSFKRIQTEFLKLNPLKGGDEFVANWFMIKASLMTTYHLPPCKNHIYRWRVENLDFELNSIAALRGHIKAAADTPREKKLCDEWQNYLDRCQRLGHHWSLDDHLNVFLTQLPPSLQREYVKRYEFALGRSWKESSRRHWYRMGVHGKPPRPPEILSLLQKDLLPEERFCRLGSMIDDYYAAHNVKEYPSGDYEYMFLHVMAKTETLFKGNVCAYDLLATYSVLAESTDFEVCCERDALLAFGEYLGNCHETRGPVCTCYPMSLRDHRLGVLRLLEKPFKKYAECHSKEMTKELLADFQELSRIPPKDYAPFRKLILKIARLSEFKGDITL